MIRRLLPFLTAAMLASPAFAFTSGNIVTYSDNTGAHVQDSGIRTSTGTLHIGASNGWLTTLSGDTEVACQVCSLAVPVNGVSSDTVYGLIGAGRTSDLTPTTADAFGIGGFVNCDNTTATVARACWGIYTEAYRQISTTDIYTQGAEFATINLASPVANNPYNDLPNNIIIGQQLTCGKPNSGTNTACTVAINIADNGNMVAGSSPYLAGIVFGKTALNGNNGTSGTAVAVAMPKGDQLTWYTSESSGTVGAIVRSDVSTAAQGMSMIFTNGGTVFEASDSSINFEVDALTSGTNHIKISAATVSNPSTLTTSNGNLVITSAGGVISIGATLNSTALTTGTPAASLCIDASNNIIKKTSSGSCI